MQPDTLSGTGQECVECRTVLSNEAKLCGACGCKHLRPRVHSRFPYDAMAAFIGVIAVILYWVVRT